MATGVSPSEYRSMTIDEVSEFISAYSKGLGAKQWPL